jgi:hypothetical protein
MDLRCFGLHQRTWIERQQYHTPDFFLIAFGVVLLGGSIWLSVLGYGAFWVPGALLN